MSTAQPTPKRLRREQPIAKAARLISEDRVMLDRDAQVYRVLGDSETYNVVASPDGIWCPCPARSPLCSHVLATAMVRMRGKPVPERLLKDLGVQS